MIYLNYNNKSILKKYKLNKYNNKSKTLKLLKENNKKSSIKNKNTKKMDKN
jgi:hypothetical protein